MSKYIPGDKIFSGFAWWDLYFMKFWELVDDTIFNGSAKNFWTKIRGYSTAEF